MSMWAQIKSTPTWLLRGVLLVTGISAGALLALAVVASYQDYGSAVEVTVSNQSQQETIVRFDAAGIERIGGQQERLLIEDAEGAHRLEILLEPFLIDLRFSAGELKHHSHFTVELYGDGGSFGP